jgi:hypothetical protein
LPFQISAVASSTEPLLPLAPSLSPAIACHVFINDILSLGLPSNGLFSS